MTLSLEEIDRYERHVLLPEWGAAGQERVRAARVEVRGRGAGAEAALRYLAGAGIGVLVADEDVEEARALNPLVRIDRAERAADTHFSLHVGAARIAGDGARAAVGAAAAVEALKAILGLPFRARVDVP